MTEKRPRKRGATIDYPARARQLTRDAHAALRAFTLCQLTGRAEEAAAEFRRLNELLLQLDSEIMPHL